MMTKHLLRFQLKTFNQSKLRHKFIRLSHHKKSHRNVKEIARENSVIFSESALVQTPLLINYFSREGIIFLPTLLAASVIASETKCEALEENEDQNEEAYDEEAETCPFCRYFLDSPCREQFKAWHACVQVSILFVTTFLRMTSKMNKHIDL
jgi:hypothetical protein